MKRASRRLIAYYRVSTQKQGASGLGLEGKAAVAANALANVLERLPALLNERRRPTVPGRIAGPRNRTIVRLGPGQAAAGPERLARSSDTRRPFLRDRRCQVLGSYVAQGVMYRVMSRITVDLRSSPVFIE